MKILILKPQKMCYDVIEAFADNFGRAFIALGVEIVYFDLKKESLERLADVVKERFEAVLEFYSGLLSVKDAGGQYIWNRIHAPVFQICVDFPVYISDIMRAGLYRYYALCSDRNYCKVVKDYMPNILDAFFFPMTGRESMAKIPWNERKHDLVFIGSYEDYRDCLLELNQCDQYIRDIGYTFFVTMRSHVELNQKQALESAFDYLKIQVSKDKIYSYLKMIGGIARAAVFYHREQMIQSILDAGYSIEVYGASWTASPFAKHSNLIIHDQLNENEYISVLADTKVSLNISYCSKEGYSERYMYSMLNGAVCVSDESEFLCSEFSDKKNIVFYQLNCISELPKKIAWVFDHPYEAQKIADQAYEKAKAGHTWQKRAEEFLRILNNIKK